jgi:hypothetical protein
VDAEQPPEDATGEAQYDMAAELGLHVATGVRGLGCQACLRTEALVRSQLGYANAMMMDTALYTLY